MAFTDTFLSSNFLIPSGEHEDDPDAQTLRILSHAKVTIHDPIDMNTQKFLQNINAQRMTFPSVDSVVNFIFQQREGAIFKLPADLRCFRYSFHGNFLLNCVDASLSKTCTKLVKAINSAYNINPIQSNESEMQLTSVIDACLFLFNVVLEQIPVRNVPMSTSGRCKPAYSMECVGKFPLVMGEEKLINNYIEGTYGNDPYVESLGKIPLTRWNEFFGDLPFIFGYHALGDVHSNDLTFGLIHPTVNEKDEHFTPFFHGNLVNITDREEFCSILYKLLPVLTYLRKQCFRQVVKGYSWKHSMCREGFQKTLRVVMMRSSPVLEMKWSAVSHEILDPKMRMIKRVVDLIGTRCTSTRLHFHPSHQKIECLTNEFGIAVEYKCFMIPYGQPTVLRCGRDFKQCLQNVCEELKWCHEHNLIHNDIFWCNICTLDNVYYLIDFDDAWILSGDGELCPPNAGLDPNTHFKVNQPHGFETDLWAIGHLMITADKAGYTITQSQHQLGMQIMEGVEEQSIKNINQIIELVNNMNEN